MTVVNVPLALRKTAGTAFARHPWMYAPSVVLALLAAYAWQHHIVAGRINGERWLLLLTLAFELTNEGGVFG